MRKPEIRASFGFDIDTGAWRKLILIFKRSAHPGHLLCAKRRVQEYDIELIRIIFEEVCRVTTDAVKPAVPAQDAQMPLDRLKQTALAIHEDKLPGASRHGLETQGTATRKEIQTARARYRRL